MVLCLSWFGKTFPEDFLQGTVSQRTIPFDVMLLKLGKLKSMGTKTKKTKTNKQTKKQKTPKQTIQYSGTTIKGVTYK